MTSRGTCRFFMKEKSETLSKFKEFKEEYVGATKERKTRSCP
jgi:hypothetical protein